MSFDTTAVVFEQPGHLALSQVCLAQPDEGDCVVDIEWSGISTGTERLLWLGQMPDFPGMGYPLVPGYESVGRIVDAGKDAKARVGEWVFVPGSNGFTDARGLFRHARRRLRIPTDRGSRRPEDARLFPADRFPVAAQPVGVVDPDAGQQGNVRVDNVHRVQATAETDEMWSWWRVRLGLPIHWSRRVGPTRVALLTALFEASYR